MNCRPLLLSFLFLLSFHFHSNIRFSLIVLLRMLGFYLFKSYVSRYIYIFYHYLDSRYTDSHIILLVKINLLLQIMLGDMIDWKSSIRLQFQFFLYPYQKKSSFTLLTLTFDSFEFWLKDCLILISEYITSSSHAIFHFYERLLFMFRNLQPWFCNLANRQLYRKVGQFWAPTYSESLDIGKRFISAQKWNHWEHWDAIIFYNVRRELTGQ